VEIKMKKSGPDRRTLLTLSGGLIVFSGLGRGSSVQAVPSFKEDPFSLGVAAGDPLPDGFVIWTRLAPKPLEFHGGMLPENVAVRWEVAEDRNFSRIAQAGDAVARPELAHSIHVEVEGLRPARPYWYRFFLAGGERSETGVARTAPAPGAMPERLRIVNAGCQSYPHGWYDAWRHISREPDLDAVFHYGDYIYEYGATNKIIKDASGQVVDRQHLGGEVYSLDDYRRRYAQYKADPDLRAAHAAAAFIVTFDDHEVDNDWVSDFDQDGTPPELFALRRVSALQAWYEHMPVRRAQFPHPAGIKAYRRLDYGRLLRLHALDTRSFRSDQLCVKAAQPHCRRQEGPDSTVLGAAQEAWLNEGLGNGARWNLIAQQVRMMPLLRTGSDKPLALTDQWSGYPAARARLVKAITDHKLTNVIVATGDAHVHNVGTVPLRDEEIGGAAAAVEFLATSISSDGDGAPQNASTRSYLDSPNLALANAQRGYQRFEITPKEWRTDVNVLDRVQSPGGKLSRLARFTVTPDRSQLHKS
jgi:alkaline phosphatase D